MDRPRFHHLVGNPSWRRCDHWRTRLDAPMQSVRLATAEQVDDSSAYRIDAERAAAWEKLRGGAVVFAFPSDKCARIAVVITDSSDEDHGRLLFASADGYEPVVRVAGSNPDELRFASAFGAPFFLDEPASLERDPFGRLWMLERGTITGIPGRVRLLSEDDFRVLATVWPPSGSDLVDVATTAWGVVAVDRAGGRIWVQAYGGDWEELEKESKRPSDGLTPVAVSGAGRERAFVVFRSPESERPVLGVVDRDGVRYFELRGFENPFPVLALSDEELVVGELEDFPTRQGVMAFERYHVGDHLDTVEQLAVRGFDGRSLIADGEGRILATTRLGLRPLYSRQPEVASPGEVETYALDSEQYGCDWHRVFIDVCLPSGTEIEVRAKTADDLPPESLRREAKVPHGTEEESGTPTASEIRENAAWSQLPIAARTVAFVDADGEFQRDEEGWVDVGVLDRRAEQVDIPFPPTLRELPAFDDRCAGRQRLNVETLEGLIKNPPGRYLWLRFRLRGTRRKSPSLFAVRATYPRPSLLDYLPSYWRAEPRAAVEMDHLLALFEGPLTEVDQRIEELRHLFDPRICPSEVIEWLATFVALAFDRRVRERVRRRLLMEMTELYRERGTAPGLERLCSILAESRVMVVEGFRVRRRTVSYLGATGEEGLDASRAIVGPGFQLGWREEAAGDETEAEDWEVELHAAHDALMKEREELEKNSAEALCPLLDPPEPLDDDPIASFFRHYAHRFTVLLFRERSPELEDLIDTAVEATKPAHTIHRLCWLEEGFRLGTNTYLGIGTRFAGTDTRAPAIVGPAAIGRDRTISLSSRASRLGTFVGGTELGRTSISG